MLIIIVAAAGLILAFANGANDNFKGVATLFGSGLTDYRKALALATITTLLGSFAAVLLAGGLISSFSGKGLVDPALVSNLDYTAGVAFGAGLTVLLATRIGMPVSTTHSLVGALVGAGLAAGSPIDLARLGSGFFVPLLLSPPLAVIATILIYRVFRNTRKTLGVTEETCLCAGTRVLETVPATNHYTALKRAEVLSIETGDRVTCRSSYSGNVMGIEAKGMLDKLHFLSAGSVSFARGLNDTPKIAALLLVVPAFKASLGIGIVGIAIAVGGLLSARRVATTMSQGITRMNHGQGFTANLVTSGIVIAASRYGLPVSTTHVSCGALFGLGSATKQANWGIIGKILIAWITTLPMGAFLGALAYLTVRML